MKALLVMFVAGGRYKHLDNGCGVVLGPGNMEGKTLASIFAAEGPLRHLCPARAS